MPSAVHRHVEPQRLPAQSLANRGIEAIHPDEFLVRLYELDSVTVLAKLRDQAATIGRDLSQVLTTLRTGVPKFAARVVISAVVFGPLRHLGWATGLAGSWSS